MLSKCFYSFYQTQYVKLSSLGGGIYVEAMYLQAACIYCPILNHNTVHSHRFSDNHLLRCHSFLPPRLVEIKILTEIISAFKVEKVIRVVKLDWILHALPLTVF